MKIKYILLIMMIASSCGQELDIDPATQLDAEQAKQNLNLLLTGSYSIIGSGGDIQIDEGGLYATDLILNADLLASENYMLWSGTFEQYTEVAYKFISPTNVSITRMWKKAYSAIGIANTILEILPEATVDNPEFYRGQALFIRGIMHFELLKFWKEPSRGLGIPIVKQSTQVYEDIQYPVRAGIEEVYTAVLDDLLGAEAILSDNNGVYANRFTVAAFLARVYLERGEYDKARDKANEVIESGNYELAKSVENAFNTSYSNENVFEIQQTIQNNAGTTNDGLTTFYACDPDTPGNASRGDIKIDSTFITGLYDVNDKRRSLLIYKGTCSEASVTSAKWKNPYTNIPVIRLSEMYLIRAEANQRLNTIVGDTPLDDINAIRSKANASVLLYVNLNDILLERERELAFEGHRIHDFKRTEKTTTVEDGEGNVYEIDYTGAEFILPIPQTEINTNKNLRQNSYYE